jgi:hypothetical protein
MRRNDFAFGAGLAGALLVAIAAFDFAWVSDGLGPVHAIVGLSGGAMLAASFSAGLAGRGG